MANWFSNTWRGLFGSGSFSPFGQNRFNFLNPIALFNSYDTEKAKIEIVFSNPAVLKVFALSCDLFSMGEIYVYDGDKLVDKDPLLEKLINPNPFQSKKQFLWDYRFWTMIGTANLYINDKGLESDYTKLYFLDNSKLEYPHSLQKDSDKLVLSKGAEKDLMNKVLKYRYNDGTFIEIKLKELSIFTDLTNGLGNWFKSPSRIDALYKVISNSEAALDAKNINVRYSGKFMVAGTSDPDNVTQLPLSEPEKTDIESKMNGERVVHAVKSMIDIKRFVENIANLKLDESYMADYYIIGSMFGIPKDVLEAYNSKGSTYENQEKAVGRHVSYSEQPKADMLMDGLNKRFEYNSATNSKRLVMSFDHLSFMQVFEKERAEVQGIKANTFATLKNEGVALDEINRFLDTDFKNVDYERTSKQTGS